MFTDADYIPKQVTQAKDPRTRRSQTPGLRPWLRSRSSRMQGPRSRSAGCRERWNWEADQRAADGFFRKRGRLAARRDEWSA